MATAPNPIFKYQYTNNPILRSGNTRPFPEHNIWDNPLLRRSKPASNAPILLTHNKALSNPSDKKIIQTQLNRRWWESDDDVVEVAPEAGAAPKTGAASETVAAPEADSDKPHIDFGEDDAKNFYTKYSALDKEALSKAAEEYAKEKGYDPSAFVDKVNITAAVKEEREREEKEHKESVPSMPEPTATIPKEKSEPETEALPKIKPDEEDEFAIGSGLLGSDEPDEFAIGSGLLGSDEPEVMEQSEKLKDLLENEQEERKKEWIEKYIEKHPDISKAKAEDAFLEHEAIEAKEHVDATTEGLNNIMKDILLEMHTYYEKNPAKINDPHDKYIINLPKDLNTLKKLSYSQLKPRLEKNVEIPEDIKNKGYGIYKNEPFIRVSLPKTNQKAGKRPTLLHLLTIIREVVSK